MTDAMEIAKQRRQENLATITRLEGEIENLREEIEDLDTFLEFGATLIGEASSRPTTRVRSAPAPTNTPEIREVTPTGSDESGPDQAIANVLAARKS